METESKGKIVVAYIIIKKASDIIIESEKNTRQVKSCLKAGICPICGEPLQLYMERLLWFFKSCKVICPNGHDLFHPMLGDMSDPTSEEYASCINYEIRGRYDEHIRNVRSDNF